MSDQNFQTLLAELAQAAEEQTLAKSAAAEGADDKAIQAAAAEGENPEDKEGEEGLAKSAVGEGIDDDVTLIEGDEIIKSLGLMDGRMTGVEETLAKGLATVLDLYKGQGELMKSMQARIDKLSGTGAGRKTMLQVHEKPAAGEQLTKSQPQGGITKGELMAKATSAWNDKKITGLELNVLEVALREGQAPSESTLTKILS